MTDRIIYSGDMAGAIFDVSLCNASPVLHPSSGILVSIRNICSKRPEWRASGGV